MDDDNLAAGDQSRVIAFVLIPRFNMMSLTTTIEPMRIANYLAPENLYQWTYLASDESEIIASNGMSMACEQLGTNPPKKYDMIFVFGSWGAETYVQSDLLGWLRKEERRGVPICGMEMGAYILARAGLLGDRSVTTHWSCMAGFAEQFPNVVLCEQLFTWDRNLLSCAGGSAGADLMLEIIGRQHGKYLASEVAEQMMHYPIRRGDAAQRHTFSSVDKAVHPDVEAVIKLIEANFTEPYSVPELARQVGISHRQLDRLFKRHMGCTVVQFSQLLRLQFARVLLTTTRMSVREVSAASGFNSLSYFSHAFVKCFDKKPSEYRQAWPEREPLPSWPGTVFSLTYSSQLEEKWKKQSKST
jgi:AraC family carnitine catabolism transcriptional activator